MMHIKNRTRIKTNKQTLSMPVSKQTNMNLNNEQRVYPDDLVIKINSIPAPDRFVQGKIDIKSFEKGALGDFLVATDISLV